MSHESFVMALAFDVTATLLAIVLLSVWFGT